MEDYKIEIGKRIETALSVSGKKQKDLAEYLGILPNTVSYFCKGTRTPNTEQIIKIAKFLDVSADYLLGLSKVMTVETDIKAVCKFTGLSEKSVKSLVDNKRISAIQAKAHTLPINHIFDTLLNSKNFYHIIILISRYREFTDEYVKSIIDNKTDETEKVIDKLDLEKFRMFEELKDFFEKEFSNSAFFCAKNYCQFLNTWYHRKSDDKLCLPLVPPTPLRPILPPYPKSLPIEQVEELRKNEPTQEEINKYNSDLQEYEQHVEMAQSYMKKICEKYEESERLSYGEYNPTSE